MFLKHLLFVFGLLYFNSALAQKAVPHLRHITPNQGLPSWSINCSMRDSNGFIWFGTVNGVSRFDGLLFKTFTTEDGLPFNYINYLQQIDSGLAIFCGDEAICFLKNNKITNYAFNDKVKTISRKFHILEFYIDNQSNVFIACADKGILKIDGNGNVSELISIKSESNTYYIYEFCDGNLICSMSSGPQFNATLKLFDCNKSVAHIKSIRGFSEVVQVLKTNETDLLFSTGLILWKVDNNNCKELYQATSVILDIKKHTDGSIWLATYNDGVLILNADYSFSKHILNGVSTTAIVQDNEGGFWISTAQDGIYYAPPTTIFNINKVSGLSYEVIYSLVAANQKIYAGMGNGDLLSISNKNITAEPVTNEIQGPVTQLYFDKANNKLYAANYCTFVKEANGFKALTNFSDAGNQEAMLARNDSVWYAAGQKIILISKGVTSVFCELSYVVTTLSFYESMLIAGTDSGVFIINKASPQVFLPEYVVLKNKISAIYSAPNLVCFGIENKGLFVINSNEDTLTIGETLLNTYIVSVTGYNNQLWVATTNGLFKVDVENFKTHKYQISKIEDIDGLGSNSITAICLVNDTVWVGSNKGIDFFNRSSIKDIELPPLVYIYSLGINDSIVGIQPFYELEHDYKSIKINFAAVAFRGALQTQFKYNLGIDSTWHYTYNRELQFLSLTPGNYSFKVYAKNSSGIWSTEPAVISFKINPPWWSTWWFRLSMAILIALVTYFIIYLRIKQLKKQQAEIISINRHTAELEMKALRAQMNPHFIFNVLNSIQQYMLQNNKHLAQKYLSKFAKLIRLILDNSSKTEVSLAEELKLICLYVELEQQRMENKFEFVYIVDELLHLDNLSIPSMLLQPHVENAIKHGLMNHSKKGILKLTVVEKQQFIFIVIEDNGVGRKRSAAINQSDRMDHISHGTAITEARIATYNRANAEQIKSEIIDLVDDENLPLGTRVEIAIPV